MSTPWYKNAVVYQIYPWSFKDSNGDGIGDLEGIISKLDYLNGTPDSLGVNAIWISPIFPSPMKDFGYDVSNYCDIDPRFGNLDTFKKLVHGAHKRDIKIVLDLVTNHTSSEHPWFIESRSSKTNPKRNWYVWRDPAPDGGAPNNWLSVSGGSAWEFDAKTGQYYLHQFLAQQPDLNWRNDEVRHEMKKIIEFWVNLGVDGFRVDAMGHFIEDDEFRSDPINPDYIDGKDFPYAKFIHAYSENLPETAGIIQFISETAAKRGEVFVVTESYLGLSELVKLYRAVPDLNHAPFNFNFLTLPWDAQTFKLFVDTLDSLVGSEAIPTYVLGNHDRPRLASKVGDHRARVYAMMLLTLRGMPYIYYGEEIGMKDVPIPTHLIKDGFTTFSPVPGTTRDPERTPMQWSDASYAGFSTHTPWLPISKDFTTVNVEHEKADAQSIFNFYRAILKLRNNSKALRFGGYRSLLTDSLDLFVYVREYDTERIAVLLNFSDKTVTELVPKGNKNLVVLCSTHMDGATKITENAITLRPYEGIILSLT